MLGAESFVSPMIVMENVCKVFDEHGERIEALRNVSFSVGRGESVVIMGPNGAGKTTLLKIVAGYLTPDSGKVFVNGYNVCEEAWKVRASCVLMLADPWLHLYYDTISVRRNLEIFCRLWGISEHEIPSRVRAASEWVGIEDLLDRHVVTLSTGERQRVSLARALIARAPVLLLDEPTRSVSHEARLRIWRLINRLSIEYEPTILVATHDPMEAEIVSDKVMIIDKGRIVYFGDTRRLTSEAEGYVSLEVWVSFLDPMVVEGAMDAVEDYCVSARFEAVSASAGRIFLLAEEECVLDLLDIFLATDGLEIRRVRSGRKPLVEAYIRLVGGKDGEGWFP